MKITKLAVIGAGGLAQSQHIPNISKADNAVLTTICDVNPDTLEMLKGQYPCVENFESDHKKVLADPEIDGVVIATREDTHVSLTIEALEAGKHVYVEKPLAETEDECQKVVDAQKKSGKLVAVGMNRRCAPAYHYAKELMDNNGGAHNMYYRISDSYSLDWGKRFGAGNRIIHEVCHVFDILRYFAGSEVKSVYSVTSRADDETFTLQFENGTVATILSTGYVESDMPKERFEAIVDKGGVTVDEFVEVRRFGFEDGEPVKRFRGHSHIAADHLHEPLYEEIGMEALYAVRKVSMDAVRRKEKLEELGQTDTAEYRRVENFVENHAPPRNYHMNKGWLDAVEHFCECIQTGAELKAAGVLDALQACKITEAAMKSRETGQIVYL